MDTRSDMGYVDDNFENYLKSLVPSRVDYLRKLLEPLGCRV